MKSNTTSKRTPAILVFIISVYAFLAAGYYVVRYGGQWADSDTANLSVAITDVMQRGSLYSSEHGYSAGFSYPALVASLAHVSGFPVEQLQSMVLPLVAAGLSLVAFVLYRELTGSITAAAIATLLLFMQPDFLFVIFRGSHEKTTWLATMLAVYLLAKSFAVSNRVNVFIKYAGLFYVFVFLLISSNAYMGSAFILAVEISLIGGWIITWIIKKRKHNSSELSIPRLVYVLGLAMVVWFVIIFYLYPPAADLLNTIDSMTGKSIAVGLGQEPGLNPYATLQVGWINLPAYIFVAAPTFIIGLASFVIWASKGIRLFRENSVFKSPQQLLLWLIYAGFGVQLALTIILDRLGSVSGNFQLRIFPPLLLFAVPLVAMAATDFFQARSMTTTKKWLAGLSTAFLIWASLASLLKATNDPWLGNYWIFWSQAERASLQWMESSHRNDQIWFDQQGIRLRSFATGTRFGEDNNIIPLSGSISPIMNGFVLSDITLALTARLPGVPVPDARQTNRIYDNGSTAIYRLPAQTPFQR